jgi:hypothetical protein
MPLHLRQCTFDGARPRPGIRSSPGWSAAAIATLINRRARHRLRQDVYNRVPPLALAEKFQVISGPES